VGAFPIGHAGGASAGYSQQQSLRMFVAVDRRAKGVDVALAETSLLL